MLGGAFLLHNYWAFAIGSVGGRLLSVAFSYWLNSYRPRLSLSRFRELWNFSAWMLAVSLGEQMNARFEEFVVGWLFGTRAMGLYNVALDLAYSPTDELVQPLNRSLFNVYAKIHHDKAQLAAHYRSVLSGIATVCFSTAIGVSLVAPDFVAVVLGPQWAAAVPLIVCLALGQALDPALTSMTAVLNVTGASRRSTALTWTRTSLVVPFAVLFGYVWGIEGIAWARVAVIFLMLPVFLLGICATIPIGYREVLAQFWRPALSSACMAIIVIGLSPYFSGLPPMAALALRAVAGAAVFIMVSVLLWRLAGQPEGIEATWLALCRNKVRNIRASAIP